MPNPTDKLKRRRRLRRALGALAALGVFVLLAPSANAATYTVQACTGAPGSANNSWGAYSNSAQLAAFSNCPASYNGSDFNNGIGARNAMAGSGYTASGTEAGWRLNAPAGNSLNS